MAAFLLMVSLCVGSTSALAEPHSRRATELETRLFAPCCYVQTLDVHESDLASKLRSEIVRRLEAGDSARDIEDDLVGRYGEEIRAVPRDADPRVQIPLLVGFCLALTLIALSGFALKWQRNQTRELGRVELAAFDAKLDRELDAALRSVDGAEPSGEEPSALSGARG